MELMAKQTIQQYLGEMGKYYLLKKGPFEEPINFNDEMDKKFQYYLELDMSGNFWIKLVDKESSIKNYSYLNVTDIYDGLTHDEEMKDRFEKEVIRVLKPELKENE